MTDDKLEKALNEISEGYDQINDSLSLVDYDLDKVGDGLDKIEAAHDQILCGTDGTDKKQLVSKNLAIINTTCEAMRAQIDLIEDDPKALNVLRDMGLDLEQIGMAYDEIWENLLVVDFEPAFSVEVGEEAVEDADILDEPDDPTQIFHDPTQIRLFLRDYKMSDVLTAIMDMTDQMDNLHKDLYNDAKWHRKHFLQYEAEGAHNSYEIEIT